MKVTRRTFVKGATATGAAVVASRLLFGESTAFQFLRPEQRAAPAAGREELVPTTCWIGKQDCGILARRIDGRVVSLTGHPDHPRNRGTLCPKGVGQLMAVYDPNRVKTPLIRTNGKGVPGEFRSATWDEALGLATARINETRTKDAKLVLWQKGRSKQEAIYDNAFVKALGASKLGHGAYCSDAGYRAGEYTIGLHGNANPDFKYTNYMLCWGWNVTNGGGNKFCWLTWNQQLSDARERGMKVVVVDPSIRGAGPFADAWLPIRPGTDLALALALCNALIAQGTVDFNYLRNHTNAPFLVKEDGTFLRIDKKEQVWDEATKAAVPFDKAGITPALEGKVDAGGGTATPAYRLFKDHLSKYTPEWAAEICGIDAKDIRRVAAELGANARIGATIVLDGVTLPYRPVGIMAYHVAQQELGFQFFRALYMVMMLLGAVEAVGGLRIDTSWKVHANFEALDKIQVKDPPYDFTLKDSKFFPINTGNPGMVAKVMLDPAKYGVTKLPEVMILHMTNPLGSYTDSDLFMAAYKKFNFVVAIDPWLSRTADYFADIVLPAATMEKYEGPIGADDMYTEATVFRLPVMDPLYQSRGDLDIYLGLCERIGILHGKDGFIDRLNTELAIKDPYKLDTSAKPQVREIFDRWAKSQGLADGIAFFETKGVWVKGPVSAKKYYGYAQTPPFGGIRHRLYGEALLRYQGEMRSRGAEEIYWRDYTPFPTWRSPTMWSSPARYDLSLISYKKIEFKQSRASQIPILAELAPQQRLAMHPDAARARGIADGDEVWVESHHALIGATRRVKTRASLTQTMRPDVVGLPHHYGEVIRHPWAEGQGPTPNALFFAGEGYVTNTADNSFHVRVNVSKA